MLVGCTLTSNAALVGVPWLWRPAPAQLAMRGFRQPPQGGSGPPVNPVMARGGGLHYVASDQSRGAYAGPDVPIRVLLHGDVWFTPEDIAALTAAFELALSKLARAGRREQPRARGSSGSTGRDSREIHYRTCQGRRARSGQTLRGRSKNSAQAAVKALSQNRDQSGETNLYLK